MENLLLPNPLSVQNGLEAKLAKMSSKMSKMRSENRALKEKAKMLEERNRHLEEQIKGMGQSKNETTLINGHNKVLNWFASISKENAQSKKNLAGNNKWLFCPNIEHWLIISRNGLNITHSGPVNDPLKWNSVRSRFPVAFQWNRYTAEKFIAGYFEVEITKGNHQYIGTGFCEEIVEKDNQEIHVEGVTMFSKRINEIYKGGVRCWNTLTTTIDEEEEEFFEEGDVIGCGLVCNPKTLRIKYFAICIGKLIGNDFLPLNFAVCQLFPCLVLSCSGQSVRINFGDDRCGFIYEPETFFILSCLEDEEKHSLNSSDW